MIVYIQINLVVLVVESVEMWITTQITYKKPLYTKDFSDFYSGV